MDELNLKIVDMSKNSWIYLDGFLTIGPIHNIIMNGKEITRSLSCATELAANHTAAKWELKMKPLGDVMQQFQVKHVNLYKKCRPSKL